MPRANALALVLTLAGCDPLGPGVCTTDVRVAVVVEVRDAASGAPAAAGATGYVQDGTFREALNANAGPQPDPLYMYGPWERPGSYLVVVEKAGYRPWRRDGVRVRDDGCHVRTVRLRADLQPG